MHLYEMFRKGKPIEDKVDWRLPWRGERGNGYWVSSRSDENALNLIVAMDAQLCEYTKGH